MQGYVSVLKRYQAQNCEGCPLKSQCHKSKANRIIEVNYNLNRYKQKARERLMSEEGIYHRGRRCIEPEAVFFHKSCLTITTNNEKIVQKMTDKSMLNQRLIND